MVLLTKSEYLLISGSYRKTGHIFIFSTVTTTLKNSIVIKSVYKKLKIHNCLKFENLIYFYLEINIKIQYLRACTDMPTPNQQKKRKFTKSAPQSSGKGQTIF